MMNARIINRMIASFFKELPKLGFKEVIKGKVFSKNQVIDGLGIVVDIESTSQPTGHIVFNMTEEEAQKLSAVILKGIPVEEMDQSAKNAICEMVNMVLSDAVSSLNTIGINFQLASPVVSQCNSKIRVCDGFCFVFEMFVDKMRIEIGIGFNS